MTARIMSERDTAWLITNAPTDADLGAGVREVPIDVEKLNKEWQRVSTQVGNMLAATPSLPGGLYLGEVDVALALAATGKIGFIAEVSGTVTATFTVKFMRKPQ